MEINELPGQRRHGHPSSTPNGENNMRSTLLALTAMAAAVAATPAFAEKGDVLVRLRAITVQPNETVGPVLPSFPTSGGTITNSYAPEIDFTYFATKHVAFELIAATVKHTVKGGNTLAAVGPLASTWVLPPTLTVQYHFTPDAKVRPYVGAGVNWTLFYNESASSQLNAAIGNTNVNLTNSWGFAVQAGVDIDLAKNLFLNLDAKYIDMGTRARLTTGAAVNTLNAQINPFVFGIGLGKRF
jgi:outer membrane protein